MDFPYLNINQIRPQIAIDYQKGYFNLDTYIPETKLDYNNSNPHQVLGDTRIKVKSPDLKIDVTKPLEDLGFRKFNSLIGSLKKRWKQQSYQGINKIAQDGDYLGKLEIKGNRIAELARRALGRDDLKPVLKSLPEHPPEVQLTPGRVKVEVQQSRMELTSNFHYPGVEFKPDRLKIYLARKGDLQIEAVGSNVDLNA